MHFPWIITMRHAYSTGQYACKNHLQCEEKQPTWFDPSLKLCSWCGSFVNHMALQSTAKQKKAQSQSKTTWALKDKVRYLGTGINCHILRLCSTSVILNSSELHISSAHCAYTVNKNNEDSSSPTENTSTKPVDHAQTPSSFKSQLKPHLSSIYFQVQ